MSLSVKTDELEETMDDLQNTDYEIQVAVKADLESDIDQGFGLAEEIAELQEYVDNGLEISYDQAKSIIEAGNGAMLENARETANATILLDKGVADNYIDAKQSELEADR